MLDECILQLIRQRDAFRNFDNFENENTTQDDTLVREIEAQELADTSTLRRSFDPDHDADEIFQAMRLGKASGGFIWGDSDLEFDIEDMDIDEPYDPSEQESNEEVEEAFEGDRLELDVEDILDLGMSYTDKLSQTRLDAEEILDGVMLKEGFCTESEHDSIEDCEKNGEVVDPVHATRNEHESTFDHHLSIQERVEIGEVVDPVHTTKEEHVNSHHLWTRDTDENCEAIDPDSAMGNEPERTDGLTVQEAEENDEVVHLGHALENALDNVRGKDLCVYVAEDVGEIVHLSHARENKQKQTKWISDNGLRNDKLEKEDVHMDLDTQTVESSVNMRIDLSKDRAVEVEKVEGETPLIVLAGTCESRSNCSLSQGAYEEIVVSEEQCVKDPLLKNPDADGDDMDSKTGNPKQILNITNSISDVSGHIDLS